MGARLQKRSGAWGRWSGDARRGLLHGEACGREVRETEGADRWDPRVSEGGREGERVAPTCGTGLAEGDGATSARGKRRT